MPTPPPPPGRPVVPPGDRKDLTSRVIDALKALPNYFESRTHIEGLDAGDLFSLNSVLGGTIEVQTVATLNKIREVWDPDDRWPDYGFERSSQTFPDVRLVSRSMGRQSPILGIELKGWYLLSKEGEPSFRYTPTRAACSENDLLVVVPWHLSNVLSGEPVVYEPYIESARYAADFRNYYWKYQRGDNANGDIASPSGAITPYPPAKSKISDKAIADQGGNFGRVARVKGLMEEFTEDRLLIRIAGIEARHWVNFFKTYSDAAKSDRVATKVEALMARHQPANVAMEAGRVIDLLKELSQLLDKGSS